MASWSAASFSGTHRLLECPNHCAFICLFVCPVKETCGFLLYAKPYTRFGDMSRNKAEPYIYNNDEMWIKGPVRKQRQERHDTWLDLMTRVERHSRWTQEDVPSPTVPGV